MTEIERGRLIESVATVNPAILDVVTYTFTPQGIRFVTLDDHAAFAIERIATRKGYRIRSRFNYTEPDRHIIVTIT